MKIDLKFDSAQEREDFLKTLAGGQVSPEVSLEDLEAQLIDKILGFLGQHYLKSLQAEERGQRRLSIERLQKFRRDPKAALEEKLKEKKGK